MEGGQTDSPSQAAGSGEQTNSSGQATKQLETAKTVSRQYFRFFVTVLKNPYEAGKKAGKEQFVNSIITLIFYSIIIPFLIYFGFGEYRNYFFENPFISLVVKPTLGYAIFLFLLAVYLFAAVKLSKGQATFQEIISRFGTMLVPSVALYVLALLFAMLGLSWLETIVLSLGFIGSIFITPAFLLVSYRDDEKGGLDPFYGSMIVYILLTITLIILSEIILSAFFDFMKSGFGNLF
jgi:hypothetical protein